MLEIRKLVLVRIQFANFQDDESAGARFEFDTMEVSTEVGWQNLRRHRKIWIWMLSFSVFSDGNEVFNVCATNYLNVSGIRN